MDRVLRDLERKSISDPTFLPHYISKLEKSLQKCDFDWQIQEKTQFHIDNFNSGNGSADFSRFGDNKILPVIRTIQKLYHVGNILVLAPAWKIAWLEDMYSQFFTTATARRKKTISLINISKITILSYGILPGLMELLNKRKKCISEYFRGVVCEEAHYIKNFKTIRSKLVCELVEKIPLRIALSCTPVSRGLDDLYNIMRFVDPTLFGSWHSFMSQYRFRVDSYNQLMPYQESKQVDLVWQKVRMRAIVDES